MPVIRHLPSMVRPARTPARRALTAALWGAALAAGVPALATPVAVPVVAVRPAGAAARPALELEALVQAQRQATVAAQLSGEVTQLRVKAGDAVAAGQPLAQLDARDTHAALGRAEAAVAQAEAQAAQARRDLERQRGLRQQGFISPAALEQAQTQAQTAQAVLQQAQAGRVQAGLARGFTAVTAPFAGRVLATHLEVGDLALPGRAVLTLYAPGALRAVVQVPASLQAQAQAAASVSVRLPDGRWVAPVRRQALPGADPVAQTVEWRLDLAPEDAAVLQPGQALRARFVAGAEREVRQTPAAAAAPLWVPAGAVLRRGELTAVYVAQQNRFVLRAVRAGAPDSTGGVPLLAGVSPGEAVAADAVRAGLSGAQPVR